MVEIIDILHRMRDTTGQAAEELHAAIRKAQAVLDALAAFAEDTEDGAQLIAASDLKPNYTADIPERAGLTRTENR